MNISKSTIDTLKELGYTIHFQDEFLNLAHHDKAIEMYVGYEKIGDQIKYIGKTIKATKKETTVAYVLDKINADRVYKNFSGEFNKVVKEFGLSAYPTSYGIGVSCLFVSEKNESILKSKVETALTAIGVAFTTEYSDAGWVFRYRISKSQKNIEVLSSYKAVVPFLAGH